MAWETRGNGVYYYRKRRVGRRVVSEYVGAGLLGALAAEADAVERAKRQDRQAQYRADRQRHGELDRCILRACDVVRDAATEALHAAGFHRHKGQWRRKRD